MKNTVLISSFLGRGQRWQLVALVALFFAAGCTVELYPPAQEVSNLPDGGKVDVLPDTIPRAFSFGPRMYWSQIVGSDSTYSFAVTGANKTGRWLDSIRWVPSGPFVTVNGDTLSTRAYARDNSGVTGDDQVLTYNGGGSLSIEDGNTVDMSDLLDNTDDQTIDTLTLQGDTMLQMSLSGDGAPVKELDLSALRSVVDSTRLTQDSILVYYQDGAEVGRDTILDRGTDDQTLTYNGSGSLTIESGNTVDMSDLLDNTDNQTIDTFSLSGNTLSLSLEGDGEAAQTVDLSSLTTNETITLSGDVTGSGTTAITTTIDTGAVGPDELASTAVTPGSYTHASITVDADGRVTAASSGTDNTGMTTFDVIGDAGTAETITDADELYLRGQFGINTSNSATDIINFEVDTSEIATQYDLTQVTSLVDSTRLTQDSILVYYQDGLEVGRDTISGVGTGGGGSDNLGNHIMTQNLQTNGNWISGDGGNEGIYVNADGTVTASNSITGALGKWSAVGLDATGYCTNSIEGTTTTIVNNAIEITLPPAIFSAPGKAFGASFKVTLVATLTIREFWVNVAGTNAPAISGNSNDNYVISLDQNNLTSFDYRIGNDGTDLKVWIGSLSGSGLYGRVIISNISAYTNITSPTIVTENLCSGWTIRSEGSTFDTVLKSGKVGTSYHLLAKDYSRYQSNLGTATIEGVISARGSISANNSMEITIPVTAFMTSDVTITMQVGISESANATPFQYGTLRSRLNMSTKAWSNASFEWNDPGHINSQFEIRLGDDGTNLKIWLWPIGSSKSILSGFVIKDISMSKYGFNNAPYADLVDFTKESGWTYANESTAYDNVDVTLGPFTGLGINTNSPSYVLDINSTDAVRLPLGTTAQRPTGANALLRYNSDLTAFEGYYNAQWNTLATESDYDDGSASGTTDGSGDITVSHALGSASISVTATTTGTTFYHVQVHTKTSTTFKIRFFDAAGAAVTATAVTADWIAKLQ